MKRNRESKNRIKIIQQRNMNKQQQVEFDSTTRKYNISYSEWYKALNLDRNALNCILNRMMNVEMREGFGQGYFDFTGVFDDYDFLLRNNKPYWIGIDLSVGKDCIGRIRL